MERLMVHDIPELTCDAQGYVYWKGASVDHWSSSLLNGSTRKGEARALAERCRRLEHLGVEVRTRSAVWFWTWFAKLQPGEPYTHLMGQCPELWEHEDGRRIAIDTLHEVFRYDGHRWSRCHSGPMWSYHAAIARGYRIASVGQDQGLGVCYGTTKGVRRLFERYRVPPDLESLSLETVQVYEESGLSISMPYTVVLGAWDPPCPVCIVHTDGLGLARKVYHGWVLEEMEWGGGGEWELVLYEHTPASQAVVHQTPSGGCDGELVYNVTYRGSKRLQEFSYMDLVAAG
jgi:hypothetical protein